MQNLTYTTFDANAWRKPAYFALQEEFGGRCGAAPSVAADGIVHAATFWRDPALSAGSFFAVFGSGFGTRVVDWSQSFVNGIAPTSLDGVRILVDGQPAFLSLVSPNQINAIAPPGVRPGRREVIVERFAQPSVAAMTEIGAVAPGLFQFSPRSGRFVAAVAGDGSGVIAPADLFGGPVNGVVPRPAKPGETLLLFGTGLGETSPPTGIGRIPAGAAGLVGEVRIRIGDADAVVDYAGRTSFLGLLQFNVRVPDLAPGEYPVQVRIGGVNTSASSFLAVGQN
ncbi:MAG: hypothetical protein FJW36_11205 [Acidobacteria bacterium]|nr:hypothetical protein [Acidobacteriota bacterium]